MKNSFNCWNRNRNANLILLGYSEVSPQHISLQDAFPLRRAPWSNAGPRKRFGFGLPDIGQALCVSEGLPLHRGAEALFGIAAGQRGSSGHADVSFGKGTRYKRRR